MSWFHRHHWRMVDAGYGEYALFGGGDATRIFLKCDCGKTKEETRDGRLPSTLLAELYEPSPTQAEVDALLEAGNRLCRLLGARRLGQTSEELGWDDEAIQAWNKAYRLATSATGAAP